MAEVQHIVEVDTDIETETTPDGVKRSVVWPHGWFLASVEPHMPLMRMMECIQADDPGLSDAEARAIIRDAARETGKNRPKLVYDGDHELAGGLHVEAQEAETG